MNILFGPDSIYVSSLIDQQSVASLQKKELDHPPLCDAVADDEPLPAPHVLLPHRRELHLARRVQDVQQTRLWVYHSPLLIRVLSRI